MLAVLTYSCPNLHVESSKYSFQEVHYSPKGDFQEEKSYNWGNSKHILHNICFTYFMRYVSLLNYQYSNFTMKSDEFINAHVTIDIVRENHTNCMLDI